MSKAGDVEVSGSARDINTGIQVIIDRYVEAGGEPKVDLAAAIRRYLDALRARTRTIKLRGIRIGAVDLSLRDVYLDLTADRAATARDALLAQKSKGNDLGEARERDSTIHMRQLLAQGPLLAVTGGPGCGKSTVLQHVAWSLAEALATDEPKLAQRELGMVEPLPLPVLLPLNRFAAHRATLDEVVGPARKLARFIDLLLGERHGGTGLPADFFERLLDDGRAVVLLLDGLDEVPSESERVRVSQAIEDLQTACPHLRLVVTCRTRAYHERVVLPEAFREIRVRDLSPEQVASLIRAIYGEVYRDDDGVAAQSATELVDAIGRLEAERRARQGDERRLVVSPLMVRLLVIVHLNERTLPNQRAELYDKVVASLLTADFHADAEVGEAVARLGGDHRVRLAMLQEVAWQMHVLGDRDGREIEEGALTAILTAHLKRDEYCDDEEARERAAEFIAVERARASLMECLSGQWRFTHLTFQEFLAARRLAIVGQTPEAIAAELEQDTRPRKSWWREVALLTIGYLFIEQRPTANRLIERMAHLTDPQPPFTVASLGTAELASVAALEWPSPDALRARLARRLTDLVFGQGVPGATAQIRARAANALAGLGDPRFDPERWHLPAEPLLGFLPVLAGTFQMGSDLAADRDASGDEAPSEGTFRWKSHPVVTNAYYVARYPVTVAQFAACAEDRDDNGGRQPHDPYNLTGRSNHPVVRVSWREANAYCRWLTRKLRGEAESRLISGSEEADRFWTGLADGSLVVALPSEAEWERAARGDDGSRIYPWDGPFDPDRANVAATRIDGTSAVGLFAGGASPYGCLDISGNVWEWTRSVYRPYPYEAGDGRESIEALGPRVVRGGSWDDDPRDARAAFRLWSYPGSRSHGLGFRVVVAAPDS